MATTSTSVPSSVISFFAELVGRLFSKSPTFFKVIQIVSAIVAVVTGLPTLLSAVSITLPASLAGLENNVIAIAGLVSLFISSLPVTTTTATAGTAVTISPTLPFTLNSNAAQGVTPPASQVASSAAIK